MSNFMREDFLLENNTARVLFHKYAKDVAIFDYHCHLNPKEIYEDKRFEDLSELWLGGDHYKWRLMRANGIPEALITGAADGYEKFLAFASCMPYAIGNPLYHWSHLELQRYFNIYEPINSKNAPAIWERANARIKESSFSVRQLIKESHVYALCTTDDPADDLKYHILLKADKTFQTKVLPAMRPDKALNIAAADFSRYIAILAKSADTKIEDFDGLCQALRQRIEFFNGVGCRASDHDFSYLPYEDVTHEEADGIFKKALRGEAIAAKEADQYKTALMVFLGSEYKRKNWVMELHIGALRNNSSRSLAKLGINTGFDSIHDSDMAVKLSRLLDHMDRDNNLPKTIFFSMNPKDNWILATMAGNFQSEETICKLQLGTAWWMQDHRDGMEEQMRVFANTGLLGRFIGMLTDSRSFISYTRHEYFRRILCNLVGKWIENGEYPEDLEAAGGIIQDICLNNAKGYFNI